MRTLRSFAGRYFGRFVAAACLASFGLSAANQPVAHADDLADRLRALDTRVIGPEQAAEVREAVRRDVRARIKAAEDRESAAWRRVKTQDDWVEFSRRRIDALGRSIGQSRGPIESIGSFRPESRPPREFVPQKLGTTATFDGDGFTIENVMFESRPGLVVAGNLYRPKPARGRKPGFLICHSHHAPKTQGELQDMGMTWARSGSAVLVIDQLGHGERRTHEFGTAGKYAGEYRPSRQDYYFRYNTGLQLAAVGESLLGWMVHDLRCGVTLLEGLPEVDPKQIVLLGAVAGGGDPAGVAGALDSRIAAVVPFNFGGYEPEDGYPLPDDAETSFRYSGGSDWESTRSLRSSASDGFMPWTIIASTAPRRLVYAHEFRWDEPRDPVWKRLNTVFGFYDAKDQLGTIVGHGGVRQSSAEASHCTNIGPVHRAQLYPLLERWFGVAIPKEYSKRLEPAQLQALPKDFTPVPLHETLRKTVAEQLAAARLKRSKLDTPNLRQALREDLPVPFQSIPLAAPLTPLRQEKKDGLSVAYYAPTLANAGRPIALPMIVLRANLPANSKPTTARSTTEKPTIVIAVAQGGKEKLLKERAELFAACLARGAIVAVCDLSGTGETEPRDEGRGRTGGATSRSVSEQMLGETTLGARVRDLLSIVAFFRTHDSYSDSPIALYGDGLVASNDLSRPIAAPLDAVDLPKSSEPLGADACLLAGLFDDDIAAIYAAGGLVSSSALLDAPYFYIPHDAIVPGLAVTADMSDLLASQTTRVWTSDLRDGANRAIDEAALTKLRQQTENLSRTHRSPLKAEQRRFSLAVPTADELAAWLIGEGAQ